MNACFHILEINAFPFGVFFLGLRGDPSYGSVLWPATCCKAHPSDNLYLSRKGLSARIRGCETGNTNPSERLTRPKRKIRDGVQSYSIVYAVLRLSPGLVSGFGLKEVNLSIWFWFALAPESDSSVYFSVLQLGKSVCVLIYSRTSVSTSVKKKYCPNTDASLAIVKMIWWCSIHTRC